MEAYFSEFWLRLRHICEIEDAAVYVRVVLVRDVIWQRSSCANVSTVKLNSELSDRGRHGLPKFGRRNLRFMVS